MTTHALLQLFDRDRGDAADVRPVLDLVAQALLDVEDQDGGPAVVVPVDLARHVDVEVAERLVVLLQFDDVVFNHGGVELAAENAEDGLVGVDVRCEDGAGHKGVAFKLDAADFDLIAPRRC